MRLTIAELETLLASKPKRLALMKKELVEVAKTFGDERRTEITSDSGLVPKYRCMFTMSTYAARSGKKSRFF